LEGQYTEIEDVLFLTSVFLFVNEEMISWDIICCVHFGGDQSAFCQGLYFNLLTRVVTGVRCFQSSWCCWYSNQVNLFDKHVRQTEITVNGTLNVLYIHIKSHSREIDKSLHIYLHNHISSFSNLH